MLNLWEAMLARMENLQATMVGRGLEIKYGGLAKKAVV